MEQTPTFDASKLNGLSEELLFVARYNGIIGAGVTPATDAESLKALGEKVVEHGGFSELKANITAALKEYDAYRPQIMGATIAVGDANKLKFIAASPEKSLPTGVKLVKQGFLVAPKEVLTDGQMPTLETVDVVNLTAAYTAAGAQYDACITGKQVDPGKQYVAVAYTIYEVGNEQYTLFSNNDYENQSGVKTATNGCCIKSVYEIARAMAMCMAQDNDAKLDWNYLGSATNKDKIATATEETVPSLHDVFLFTGTNRQVLDKIVKAEEKE